jgi:hypothetical protein
MILDRVVPEGGQIVVLQPRRMAARMLAVRVAQERGEAVGRTVGYQVRMEGRSSAQTRILYVTEGILLRRMIGDPELKVAKLYDMLPADAGTTSDGRTAANNATVSTVFLIGPDKKIKLMLVYPMSTGRNFDEVLRVLDSIQLTAKHQVATPVNWKPGQDVIIAPSVSDDDAKKKYPGGWKTVKPYLRVVPQPK